MNNTPDTFADVDRPTVGTTRRRHRAAVLLVSIVTAAAALVVTVSPASAWQYSASGGRPGGVTAPAPVNVSMLSTGFGSALTFYSGNPRVSRSPATTGAQDVTVVYSLQKWNGRQWVQVAAQQGRSRIPAGVQQAYVPHPYIQPISGRGYYRMAELFIWYVAGTSSSLGARLMTPSVPSDHRCTYSLCAAVAGYVSAG